MGHWVYHIQQKKKKKKREREKKKKTEILSTFFMPTLLNYHRHTEYPFSFLFFFFFFFFAKTLFKIHEKSYLYKVPPEVSISSYDFVPFVTKRSTCLGLFVTYDIIFWY